MNGILNHAVFSHTPKQHTTEINSALVRKRRVDGNTTLQRVGCVLAVVLASRLIEGIRSRFTDHTKYGAGTRVRRQAGQVRTCSALLVLLRAALTVGHCTST